MLLLNAAKIEAKKPDYQDVAISGNLSSDSCLIGLAGPEHNRRIITVDLRGKTTQTLLQITKENYTNPPPHNAHCKFSFQKNLLSHLETVTQVASSCGHH